MSEGGREPLFAPERWREVRELIERLGALPADERERELERVAHEDAALAGAARALLSETASTHADALGGAVDRLLEPELDAPADVGPFHLLRPLGAGGMGTVYLAERRGTDFTQLVALKLLDRGATSAPRLAARERRILAALTHPNITAFVDAGTADGRAWLAMEYVDGKPLLEWCASHDLDMRARVHLFDQVCAAVVHAHAQLVVHRDLKPANIYVNSAGAAKLLDFGIAQILDPNDDNTPATRVFTPEYAAPEQLRGERVTTATDVHALGLLLYELVSGRRLPTLAHAPTNEWSTAELARHASTDVAAARTGDGAKTVARALRGDLGRIIAHALEPVPTERYGSVALLREDLARWLDHRPLTLARPSLAYTLNRFVRRNRVAVAIGSAAVIVLLVATATAIWQARERASEAQRAIEQARRAETMQQFLGDVIREANPSENGGEPITPRQLLEKGEQLAAGFDRQPDLQAEILAQLGELYLSISDTDSAGNALQRAQRLIESPRIADSVRARVLLALTQWESVMAKFDDALVHARESLALFQRIPGTEAKTIAEVDISIAQALDGKGDSAQTAQFLHEALARDVAALGNYDDSVAELWLLLGYTLGTRGELDEAEQASRKGVDAYRAVYGNDGFEVAHGLNELALVLAWRKDGLGAAEDALREAVRIFRKVVGEEHQKTVSAERNLLTMVERRGHYAEALPEREKLVERALKPGISTPRELATQYDELAVDLTQVGRFADAENALRRSLALGEQAQGARSPADQSARQDLGELLTTIGRYDEAEKILREAIEIQRAIQPAEPLKLNLLQASLGDLLRLQRRYPEALKMLDDANQVSPSLPAHNTWRPLALARLSEAQLDAGDATRAAATARSALDYSRLAYPSDHCRNAFADYALARADLALGKAAEAEALLRDALRLRTPPHPATHPRVLEAEVALQQALAAQGKRDAARRLRSEIEPRLAGGNPYFDDLRHRLVAD